MTEKKPRALILSNTTSNPNSYFAAGLSHYYTLDVFYATPRRGMTKSFLTRTPPDLYLWQYDQDVRFVECFTRETLLNIPAGEYDAIFINDSSFFQLFPQDRDAAMVVLKNIRAKTKKFYWLELGEIFYFSFGRDEFWEMVDGVGKLFFYKPEFLSKMREPDYAEKHHWVCAEEYFGPLKRENEKLDLNRWYYKVFSFPMCPSITDKPALTWLGRKRIYDIAGNFQGNSGMRFAVQKLVEEKLGGDYKYSFDYAKDGYRTNYKNFRNTFNPFLWNKFYFGRLLFHFPYGKYFYPKPYYFHNLANTKCYLGLGHYAHSLRSADSMGAGAVLINWDTSKLNDAGVYRAGYNYFSVGERETLTDDNVHIRPGKEKEILEKIEFILSDEAEQKKLIANGAKTYQEYFSSPRQYIKKFFIERRNT